MYHLAKYLGELLKPFSESRDTAKNTKRFTNEIREQKIPKDDTIVSFHVVSFVTNLLLEDAIKIILRIIHEKKEVVTNIPKCE